MFRRRQLKINGATRTLRYLPGQVVDQAKCRILQGKGIDFIELLTQAHAHVCHQMETGIDRLAQYVEKDLVLEGE